MLTETRILSFGRRVSAALVIGLFIGAVAAAQTTYELVHAFRNSCQIASAPRPAAPELASQSGLILGSDGYLYGTSYWGGSSGVGTIFRIDSSGTLTTVHSFAYADGANPAAALLQAADGSFYGTTTRGGQNGLGTVFRMDGSGAVARLHSFSSGEGKDSQAALTQANDGNLYGVTRAGGAGGGTLYEIDLNGTFTKLHNFHRWVDGAVPAGRLLQTTDGYLCGTTVEGGANNLGTVFRFDVATNSLITIHSFGGSDGARPHAGLIQATDGNLYGTTSGEVDPYGNTRGGTVYKLDASGVLTTVHNFDGNTEGDAPYAELIQGTDLLFYGTTSEGGAEESGTVYQLDPSGGLTVLHTFNGATPRPSAETVDGARPLTALIQAGDGSFYGTTNAWQWYSNPPVHPGVLFRLDSTGAFATVHTFRCLDGGDPEVSLTQAVDGSFYGTTGRGGANDFGTIFRFDVSSGETNTLHTFDEVNGVYPGRVIQATDGAFYGTALGAGYGRSTYDGGILFRMTSAGEMTTLYGFSGPDGGWGPTDELIQATDGLFYGTTSGGSCTYSGVAGTVFRIDGAGILTYLCNFADSGLASPTPLVQVEDQFYGVAAVGSNNVLFAMDESGTVTFQHPFTLFEGNTVLAPLVLVDDHLFGTASFGGLNVKGTVFKISAGIDDLETIHTFAGSDGDSPRGALLAAADSWLYGTTYQGGAQGFGTIFRINYDGGNFITLHDFSGPGGGNPLGTLIEATDGYLYGTAGGGPFGGHGVIFRLSNAQIAVNEVAPSSGVGEAGTALTVLGGGFGPGATVTIGGVAGINVTVPDSTFLHLFTPPLSPGTLNDISVTVPDGIGTATATRANAFFADFLDAPQTDPSHDYVEKIVRNGVTAGCGGGNYCPQDSVTRAQMAVFLLKSKHGSAYVPPPCAGVFADVSCPSMFADWIEQLAAEGITAGCGSGDYCPANPVTRAQMAVFLLKTKYMPGYAPPVCTGVFGDVPCPSPFADWIEELVAEQITAGCGGGNYCPNNANTRAQMAAFLVKTFHM